MVVLRSQALVCFLPALFVSALLPVSAKGQQEANEPKESQAEPAVRPENANDKPGPDKRVFGVIPNYRTVDGTEGVEPLTVRRKFWIASRDTFDYPIFFIAGSFAALSQLEDSNPSFGQGAKGYAKRYGAGLGDQMIGNMLAEGVFPSILHEDLRYFRRGTGGKRERTWYALTRVLITRTDAGNSRFNFSEILGNSTAVAISNAYNPDIHSAAENLEKLGLQVGTDAISNMLKEFWPDIKRKLHHDRTLNTAAR